MAGHGFLPGRGVGKVGLLFGFAFTDEVREGKVVALDEGELGHGTACCIAIRAGRGWCKCSFPSGTKISNFETDQVSVLYGMSVGPHPSAES